MNIYGHNITVNTTPAVFGDGNHETTRFLLYMLSRQDLEGKTVIDAGSGSGILAIYASKRKANAIAIDRDGQAIDCTIKNALDNKADITVIQGDITHISIKGDYITANFTREEAVFLLPVLLDMLNDGGLLFTTWYKDNPAIMGTVLDYIEGIDYDCYVLRKEKK